MITIRVHLYNENIGWDDRLFVDVPFPAIPRVGEIVWLMDKYWDKLQDKIDSDQELKSDYGIAQDYVSVYSVGYIINPPLVCIELTCNF